MRATADEAGREPCTRRARRRVDHDASMISIWTKAFAEARKYMVLDSDPSGGVLHALRVVLDRAEPRRPSSCLGQLPFCRHNGQRPRSNARPHVHVHMRGTYADSLMSQRRWIGGPNCSSECIHPGPRRNRHGLDLSCSLG